MSKSPRFIFVAALFVLVAIAYFVYQPALTGQFVLDDSTNLAGLGAITGIGDWRHILPYVFTPVAGPLGRPVALATFALQYADWPNAPAAFIRVNILIHILNIVLIGALAYALARRVTTEQRRRGLIALAAAALWGLQPIHVSDVAYVVQRMNELAALFTLAGLLTYLGAIELIAQGKRQFSYALLFAVFPLCLALATFSKENGILLLVYVLVVSAFTGGAPKERGVKIWRYLFVVAPLALLAVYFASRLPSYLGIYQNTRDFSLTERLLSELRILFAYLWKVVWPHFGAYGLYFDDYPKSTSLFHPMSTLVAALGWLGLVVLALRLRGGRWWVAGFAVFWFLGGQLIESTFIPLELYFEHRNYLPVFGLIFAMVVGWSVVLGCQDISRSVRALVGIVGVAYLAYAALVTHGEARRWGSGEWLSMQVALQHPDSPRAWTDLSQAYLAAGRYRELQTMLERVTQQHPENAKPALLWMAMGCSSPQISMPSMTLLLQRIDHSKGSAANLGMVQQMFDYRAQGRCTLGYAELLSLLKQMADNRHYTPFQADVLSLEARVYLALDQLKPAIGALKGTLEGTGRVQRMLYLADLYISDHDFGHARVVLNEVKKAIRFHPIMRLMYGTTLRDVEARLRKVSQRVVGAGGTKLPRYPVDTD